MNPTADTTVLFGAAVGYRPPQMRVLLQSLRRVGFEGKIVLLVGDLPAAEMDALRALGATPIAVTAFPGSYSRRVQLKLQSPRARPLRGHVINLARWLPLTQRVRTRLLARIGVHYHHIGIARYLYAWDWLDQNPTVQRLILCDVRDVVAQSDPAKFPLVSGLHVFLEDARGNLLDGEYGVNSEYEHCAADGTFQRGINAAWLRHLYGEKFVVRLGRKPISCAGITIGDRPSMLHYLAAMTGELCRLTQPIAEGMGYDQAVHNVLLHTGRLGSKVHLHPNGSAPVFTVHGVPDTELAVDGDGRLLDHPQHGRQ
ncbi:MAG: hypothetical protein H7Y20_03295, partial [Bryobacteraceae bacterium]|nr:hypothetical protein [Bryobacteraceae bacterium]